MEKIFIDLEGRGYYINIGNEVSDGVRNIVSGGHKTMLVTDRNVNNLYANVFMESLALDGEIHKWILEPGESSKSLKTVEEICSKMLELGFTRDSKIIALGGGVVGDIAGFVASVYMRGITFLSVPTSLLACVDSSVGGKTGVNLPGGKNIIGSFYQPESVWIGLDFLKSLPRREIISGLGEIIKYGIIWDYDFLKYIEKNMSKILKLEKESLKYIIGQSCKIKAKVVSMDEKEAGIRKILNHGHTFAHAIEAQAGYKKYKHGEAVLIGMYYESRMAREMGLISSEYFKEIASIIEGLGVHLELDFEKSELLEKMMHDKKNQGGKISFILPDGKASVKEIFLSKEEVDW